MAGRGRRMMILAVDRRRGGPAMLLARMAARMAAVAAVLSAMLIVAALAGVAGPLPARAQAGKSIGIAAVVNDDVISQYDVDARSRVLLMGQQQAWSPDLMAQTRPQALRSLVDERLIMQEATRLGIEIPEDQVNAQVQQIAQGNNMSVQQFAEILRQSNVPLSSFAAQMRSELAWQSILRWLYRQIDVTDADVEARIEQLKSDVGSVEVALAEIFLSIESDAAEQTVRGLAADIVRRLDGGAAFGVLAKQYSDAPSAQQDGDMGWVILSRLDPVLRRAVDSLQPGSRTPPIRTAEGLQILQVRERRASQMMDFDDSGTDADVVLKQLLLPLPADATPARVQGELTLAERVRGLLVTCQDIDFAHEQVGVEATGDLGRYRVSELQSPVRELVSGLAAGQTTPPFRMRDFVSLLMVCEREDVAAGQDVREEIRTRIINERLGVLGRRYMRDLRRAAVIDDRSGL